MKITRKQLRLWGACYNDERIAELVPEAGLTPLEVAALDIPAEDRLWVLLREDIIPARELRLLACGWAEAVCLKTGWNDKRSLNAIAVARRFACGDATAAELASAAAEARSAAIAVARRFACGEVSAAEMEAAASASWSASGEPDWAAAWLAAEAAARSAAEAASGEPDWAASAAAEAAAEEQLAAVVQVLKG